MNMRFVEKKMSVSDAVKQYAEKKCAKLNKYFGDDPEAEVIFSNERGMETAEITIRSGGMIFRAQERTGDMAASLDGATDSLDRQIKRNKAKIISRMHKAAVEVAIPDTAEFKDEEYDLVRVKHLDVKPMTTEDAILQMNLLGHSFFFFQNSDEKGKYCVVYKRDSGGYGMLLA